MGTNLALRSETGLQKMLSSFEDNTERSHAIETRWNDIFPHNKVNVRDLLPNDRVAFLNEAESLFENIDKVANAFTRSLNNNQENNPDPLTHQPPSNIQEPAIRQEPPIVQERKVIEDAGGAAEEVHNEEVIEEGNFVQEEQAGLAVEEADVQAQQAPEPNPEQAAEEALSENMHVDIPAADLSQMDQEKAQNSNQKPQSSSLSFTSYSQQESQQSAQLAKKNSDASFMASRESFNGKNGEKTNSQPAHASMQAKANGASEKSHRQTDSSAQMMKNDLAAKVQNDNARVPTSFKNENSGNNVQSMRQTAQGESALKAQMLKNDREMSQNAHLNGSKVGQAMNNGQGLKFTGNTASPLAFLMAKCPSKDSPFGLKASPLQVNVRSSDHSIAQASGKIAKEELLSGNPSLSSIFEELKEIAAGLQQLSPKELLAMGNTLAMLPIDPHMNAMFSLTLLSQPISFSPQPSRPLILNPTAQDKAASKEITAIAAGPAPVLLSNSSAMNSAASENNEEEEEENDENTPLIRAIVFGSEEIIDEEMLSIIKTLKSNKVKLILLSQKEEHPLFDLCLAPPKILEKPDWRAYDALLEAIDLPAVEILFIDRNPAKVQDAKIRGLDAIIFTSVKQLKEELIKKKLLENFS
jgi:hypothetical protein